MAYVPALARVRGTALWLLCALVLLEGCATGLSRESPRDPMGTQGSGGGFPEPSADAFQALEDHGGLEPSAWLPAGAALSPTQAREVLLQLTRTPVTWSNQVPRQSLAWLLREVLAGDAPVEYSDLCWRAGRFDSLVLLRADGYLVAALTGTPLQRMGTLELREGQWWVGRLRVGDFYVSRGGVFYPATEALRRAPGPPLAELGLGRDVATAALDGFQEAMAQMGVALGHSILHPIRSAEDLLQLPTTLGRLLASSPEYFAHYGALSREEQIHEAARLATQLVMMLGGGGAEAAGMAGGLGAELPLLSLTARGELVVSGAVVAQGTVAVTLGVEAGALSVLSMAGSSQGHPGGAQGGPGQAAQTAPSKGPGRWVYKTPTTESEQALEYQEQITGRPAWWVYKVGDVEFDGFNGKELQEAKGASYRNFLKKDGTAQPWFKLGKGFQGLLEQAKRQSQLAKTLNLPLVWHVAEEEFARFLRETFKQNSLNTIDVRWTPPP